MVTSHNRMPSIPGGNSSRPSGAASIATSNNPNLLALAVLFGNRATKRLATQKMRSNYRKLMKQIESKI